MTQLKKSINDILLIKYTKATQWFGEESILGVFVCDSDINCGIAKDISDIKIIIIYVPTDYEDICLNLEPVNTKLSDICTIIDVRLLYDLIKTHNLPLGDLLYTQYYYINPIYRDYFESNWKANRDKISIFCSNKRLRKCALLGITALEQNDIYSAYKYLVFCKLYSKNYSYEEASNLDKNSEDFKTLWKLKYDNNYDNIYLSELKNQVQNDLTDFIESHPEEKDILNPSSDKAIKSALVSLIKFATENQSAEVPDFAEHLTANETIALKAILDKIGNEGSISIAQMTKETNVSRPVFTNLFNKMRNYGVAEIVNQGVKGTYIKITSPTAMKSF